MITTAQAKALGLSSPSSAIDGYVSLSGGIPFDYGQIGAANNYDAIGAFEHEITEVMGRVGFVGTGANVAYSSLDLYRYTSTNNANPSAGTPIRDTTQLSGNTQYFSIDGGQTNLGGFNPAFGVGADYADWGPAMGTDPFGSLWPSTVQHMSGNDMIVMAAIGWNMTNQGQQVAQTAASYALV